jgi:transposase InsO family protein
MVDRSSRPHRSPTKTSERLKRQIVRLRWRHRLGPAQIAGRLGLSSSTVHAVLVRCRVNRLSHIDRVTGEPLRRYEHDHPGSLIHVDVTKFGNIPDGGGWRYVGREQGKRNRTITAHRTGERDRHNGPRLGTAYLHTVVDDHSRMAYVEICADETAETAIGVLHRTVAWFADHGVTVERVLSDNGSAVCSHDWRKACADLEIKPNRIRHTGRRPMARSSASTEPWPTAGPTHASTPQKTSAEPPCPDGFTSTITTESTAQSVTSHQSGG